MLKLIAFVPFVVMGLAQVARVDVKTVHGRHVFLFCGQYGTQNVTIDLGHD